LQGVVISRTRLIGVVLVGGSRVVIEDSVVSTADPDDPGSGGRGAELYGGSVLEVHRSSFVANRAAGILSTGSTVVLADSEVRDTEPSVGLGDGYGIDGREGSVLDLSGSLLDGNASQGLILSDSEATLRGVTVRGTREVVAGRPGRGLQAGPDVTLVLEDVLFEANQGYDFVIGEGEATLEGVEFRDSPQVDRGTEVGGGIGALDGARLTLRSCVFDGKEGYGIYMESAEADLDGVTVRGTDGRLDRGFGTALYLWRGSKASAVDCTFEGNRHSAVAILESEADIEGMVVRDTESAFESAHAIGVSVVDGGRLDLRSSSIEGSRGYGVIVTDGSEAEVEDVVIDGVARSSDPPLGFGLVSQVESVVHADALVVRGTEGPGLFSYGASTLSCDECVIEDASFAGAAVSSSGLYLDRSRIEAASVDSWMGGGVGVYADEAEWFADVVLTRVEVAAQPLAGVYAIAIGEIGGSELALWIEYSTIAGGGDHPPSFWPYGTAIFVSGPVEPWEGAEQAGAYILDNDLVDSSGAALFLDDGASASLRSNSFVGNEVDLVQQRCGPSTPEVDAGDGAATYRGCGESPYAVDLFELDPGLDEDVPLDAGETELMPR